jgi:hypothetical protein
MTPWTYTAYGLTIQSELECPELLPAKGLASGYDVVRITYGAVPAALEEPADIGLFFQAKPNALLLRLENIANYLVRDGCDIVIEPAPGATDDEIRLFLLGSVFGALLHQRGLLVLHASAFETPDGAVLLTGRSGNGKSTVAAALRQRGYRLLTDDVCAIAAPDEAECAPWVLPAYPQAKLWADAAQKLDLDVRPYRRVRPQLEKYAVPLGDAFVDVPQPLRAIYLLETRDQETIEFVPVEDARKFGVLLANTYRWRFLDGLAMRVDHFALAAAAANAARVVRILRPLHPFMLEELVTLLEADLSRKASCSC